MRSRLIIGSGLVIALGLGIGAWRVVDLERRELEYVGEWRRLTPTPEASQGGTLLPHRELGRAKLHQGENVTFEVCAQDQLLKKSWENAGIQLAVWIPTKQKVMVQRPLDSNALDSVNRSPDGACLTIAQGSGLRETGDYAIEAIWAAEDGQLPPELRRIPFRARILAFTASRPTDRWPVVVVLIGAIILALALPMRRKRKENFEVEEERHSGENYRDSLSPLASRPLLSVITGLSALVASGFAASFFFAGSLGGLLRALFLAAVQIVIVLVLVRPTLGLADERRRILGLNPSRQGRWVFAAAPLCGIALWLIGQLPLRYIPATWESPVGAMVAWPSGSLAVALASVVSPVVEEVFFRGFVYGSLAEKYSSRLAFTVTVVIFAVAHLPQTWGAWGGLVAVTLTGIGLTVLRAWCGTIVVPTLAHLTHNMMISLLWVFFTQG